MPAADKNRNNLNPQAEFLSSESSESPSEARNLSNLSEAELQAELTRRQNLPPQSFKPNLDLADSGGKNFPQRVTTLEVPKNLENQPIPAEILDPNQRADFLRKKLEAALSDPEELMRDLMN